MIFTSEISWPTLRTWMTFEDSAISKSLYPNKQNPIESEIHQSINFSRSLTKLKPDSFSIGCTMNPIKNTNIDQVHMCNIWKSEKQIGEHESNQKLCEETKNIKKVSFKSLRRAYSETEMMTEREKLACLRERQRERRRDRRSKMGRVERVSLSML